jgi:hypothetical protein
MKIPPIAFTTLFLMALLTAPARTQNQKPIPACSQATLAAVRELPKMEYDCPENQEWDDKILKLPQRLAALGEVVKQLEGFRNPAWWRASVDELNACSVHKEVGALTGEEKDQWRNGGYSFDLIGNHEMRLVMITDPCYQTGYSGSNLYLLYHKEGKVIVSQLLNGYYSRVDNSFGIFFAKLNGEQLIELATSNSMPPTLVSYYYAIDPVTNRAVPKKIFKDGNKLTNKIYSEMLMAEPKDIGLPNSASELNIIRNGRLAPSFSAYEQDEHGRIKANDQRFRRLVYRWNGKFYARSR